MSTIRYRREQGGMETLSEKSYQEASEGRGDEFYSYQALAEAVKAWSHEEKRQEVCRYIKETAGQYPNHRGMKKKLMDLMPETPFEGEPMAVPREPNDMEKSLL